MLLNNLASLGRQRANVHQEFPSSNRVVVIYDYDGRGQPIASTFRYVKGYWVGVASGKRMLLTNFTKDAFWTECRMLDKSNFKEIHNEH